MSFRARVWSEGAPDLVRELAPDDTAEALTGERLHVSVQPKYLATTIAVTSKPTGASPLIDGEALTFDRPGRYVVTATMGVATVRFVVVAFPAEALDAPRLRIVQRGAYGGTERSTRDRRLVLRALARELTGDEVAALDAFRPLPPFRDLAPFDAG